MEAKLAALGLFCLLMILGCSTDHSYQIKFAQAKQQGQYQERYVHIEPAWNQLEQREIIAALNLWNQKSSNYIRWEFQSWPENYWNANLDHLGEKKCHKHLLIFKQKSTDKAVFDIEIKLEMQISGFATPNKDKCGIDTIFLVPDKMESLTELRRTTVHEIGHILGLTHDRLGRIPHFPKSIMSYTWKGWLDGPTDYDLNWLARLNNL